MATSFFRAVVAQNIPHPLPEGVTHGWGYHPGKVWMPKGTNCYITKYQYEGETNYQVFFSTREVLMFTEPAAKLYLKTRRHSNGKVLVDKTGKAKDLMERYQWEMSR